MSRYINGRVSALTPYVPGEQPVERKYIKLNTNESPYPPSPGVMRAVLEEVGRLQLYSDPECKALTLEAANYYGVQPDEILMTNGSDEILNFAFMAYGDETTPFVFPEITYGFYPVFADLNGIPYRTVPLEADFSIDPTKFHDAGGNVVIANPNAPTGLSLSVKEIEGILQTNPNHMVVIDEAYVDFGGETCLSLIDQYDNLLITRTFSKSYSLAGARLGFGIGNRALIADLNTIKFSTNPYNVNRMTMAAGKAALEENSYYTDHCSDIMATREFTRRELMSRGFQVTDSNANFLFAKHPQLDGQVLYEELKEQGVLIRHFSNPLICQYNRITVGTVEQMKALLEAIDRIIEKRKDA
ncbi:MAG: histidinol-phosphate transaminase [Clostridia bacterium]|nr:histidinol-phosphate transaminase [Clostridia bacterium]